MPDIGLHDCYAQDRGRAFATGTQALVRLLLEQARRDRQAGRNTRGLVTGYPGSPLGGLDLELHRAKSFLDADGIIFQPAVNEELAATALWGSQHIHLYDQPDIDGVFGLWYGKGPGLDRSLDALRHANMGGVSPHGGLVFAVGDDDAVEIPAEIPVSCDPSPLYDVAVKIPVMFTLPPTSIRNLSDPEPVNSLID